MTEWKIDGIVYGEAEQHFLEYIAQNRADETGRPAIIHMAIDGADFKPVKTVHPTKKGSK